VRDIFWVGPFPFSGLVGFRRLFLLGLFFHTHSEVIVRATILLELFV
jgi:hypothetical protein